MNIKYTTLSLILVWGACYANISHATIVTFESMGVVEFVAEPLPGLPAVGDPVADLLVLDVGDDGKVTDIISFSSVGGGTLTPVDFDLTFVDGALTGFLNSFVTDVPSLSASDVWDGNGGIAKFVISIDGTALGGPPGPVELLGGTNTFTAVPEPSSLGLLGLGLLGLGLARRRKA